MLYYLHCLSSSSCRLPPFSLISSSASAGKPVGGWAELELGVDGGARHPELLAGVRLLLLQVVLPQRHVDPPHRLDTQKVAIMITIL